jgi:hypothetical protein
MTPRPSTAQLKRFSPTTKALPFVSHPGHPIAQSREATDGILDSPATDWVVRALRGAANWPPTDIDGELSEPILACAKLHRVEALLHAGLRGSPIWPALPEQLRSKLARINRKATARELFLAAEVENDLNALAAAGIEALLLKGTALAYTLYSEPVQRPRCDIDLLLRDRATADQAWALLQRRSYKRQPAVSGELISHEFCCVRHPTPDAGLVLDVHWRISNSNFFANKLSFNELHAERVPVPTLGPHAWALDLPHALLHALFHRFNDLGAGLPERALSIYDIDLICRNLGPSQWERFIELVTKTDLGPICMDGLERSRQLFETPLPPGLEEDFKPANRKSYRQLDLKQPGYRRFAFQLQSLPSWRMRLHYLREHLLPDRRYMEQRFGARNLPTLLAAYVRRAWRGSIKRLRKLR